MQNSAPGPEGKYTRGDFFLVGLALVFVGLAALFVGNVWGHASASKRIPLVDHEFLDTSPLRQTYADLVRAKEDLSDYDCYACHEQNKPPLLVFDANQKIIVPKEHSNIVMGHGSHDRNNLCYNCHNEQNLLTFQVRDGRELKLDNIVPLCGSCHGPTYRDWEAGAHGRTNGHWDRAKGDIQRLSCANCHNPHAPRIPSRQPAPGPHPLRDADNHTTVASGKLETFH